MIGACEVSPYPSFAQIRRVVRVARHAVAPSTHSPPLVRARPSPGRRAAPDVKALSALCIYENLVARRELPADGLPPQVAPPPLPALPSLAAVLPRLTLVAGLMPGGG